MAEGYQSLIVNFIQNYGIWFVFIGMVVEEVLFVIPASLIIVIAGATLIQSTSIIPALVEIFFEISLVGSFGITLGSFFMYGIGFYGGKPAINRIGERFNFSYEDVERFENKLGSEREKEYLALFRILPVFPITTISAAAGLLRLNKKSYAVITFLGMIPRHIGYGYLGWQAGKNYQTVISQIAKFSKTVTIIGVSLIALYLIYRFKKAKIHRAISII